MSEAANERWAVVLGVSAGTGAAIARSLARDAGLNIFGVHRGNHPEEAEALRREVEAAGRKCLFRIAEGGKADNVTRGADEARERLPPKSVHMLVHSLANGSVGALVALPGEPVLHPKQITKTFESMAHSFVYWTNALLQRELFSPGARILALSNPLGHTILPQCGAIAATKGALEVYVRYMAHALGPHGYRVNMLLFGALETHALKTVMAEEEDRVAAIRHVHERWAPGRRLVKAEEVARFVSVLAGEDAAWFNGAVIDFSGSETLGYYHGLLSLEQERE